MKIKSTAPVDNSIDNKQAPITKLDRLVTRLRKKDGVTIAELSAVAGWQTHSVRGAMAGSLKKRGHTIVSEKQEGVRRYRIEPVA